jgi:hypothetical protein
MKSEWCIDSLWLAAGLLSVCIPVGCARQADRAYVTGTLQTRDGTPLRGASVIATSPETGKSAQGRTDQDGNFELGMTEKGDGLAVGNYNVGIVEDRGDPDNRRPPTIAAKYGDPAKSGITLTVTAGESKELNLKLDPP